MTNDSSNQLDFYYWYEKCGEMKYKPTEPYYPGQKFSVDGYWWAEEMISFARDNYWIPTVCTIIYLIAVFGLKKFFEKREPLYVRPIFFVWNVALAIFSIIGAYNVVPLQIDTIERIGGGDFGAEICSIRSEFTTPWVFFFVMSKIPELFDTIFLAVRKRPIIFLHWYHHIATMWFSWHCWCLAPGYAGFFASMNLVVHSIMYSYYALMTLRLFRAPALLRASITSLQIFQMVGGLMVLFYAKSHCPVSLFAAQEEVELNINLGIGMYFSYFLLFCWFFISNYIFKRQKPTPTKPTKTKKSDDDQPKKKVEAEPETEFKRKRKAD